LYDVTALLLKLCEQPQALYYTVTSNNDWFCKLGAKKKKNHAVFLTFHIYI